METTEKQLAEIRQQIQELSSKMTKLTNQAIKIINDNEEKHRKRCFIEDYPHKDYYNIACKRFDNIQEHNKYIKSCIGELIVYESEEDWEEDNKE